MKLFKNKNLKKNNIDNYHNAVSSPVNFVTAPGIYKSRDPNISKVARWLELVPVLQDCKPCTGTLTRTGTCSRYHGKQASHL